MDGALESAAPAATMRIDPEIVDALVTQHRAVPGEVAAEAAALPPRSPRQGATWDGAGTTFAVYAGDATAVKVALIDGQGQVAAEYRLLDHRNNVWSGYLPNVGPGQRYGYRVDGPYDPGRGLRHNQAKLLLDPYARAITGKPAWNASNYGYDRGRGEAVPSAADSASSVPYSVVVDDSFDWSGDRAPQVPEGRTVIYEAHVKGTTAQHPQLPAELRGTYAGLGSPAVTSHLRHLGVTAVELMPVQAFLDRSPLVISGLKNYWGYDTIGFFAPEQRYAASVDPQAQVREFKTMVKNLHAAGLEVILDVVYNHTPEGSSDGPTICFRGVDNRTYYTLDAAHPARDVDVTGCGNTVQAANPQTLKLVIDSLRYWVEEMHVDGFRFDVAPALARRNGDFDTWSPFFAALNADPLLATVKLIAEPWDLGRDGYQVGNFPPGWSEWNGRFRDTVRDYWRGATAGVSELATRLAGSQDLYARHARGPMASVNFVTCHDGFTLRDNVSYNVKHNLANAENNRDGVDENRSWNHGVEGPSNDAVVTELRARQQRNLLATLLLALGQPMLLGGDEISRTQGGNNNPYNQDNATSWFDWSTADQDLAAFVAKLGRLRQAQPVLQRTTFLQGRVGGGALDRDCVWLRPDGGEMTATNWHDGQRQSLALLLNGQITGERNRDGVAITGDTLLTIYHASAADVAWTLPQEWGDFEVVIDTDRPGEAEGSRSVNAGGQLIVRGRSVVVLRRL